MKTSALAAVFLVGALPATAHHAFTEYDETRSVEIDGTLLAVQWVNPHVHFKLQAGSTVWDIEGHSLSILRRTNATPDQLKVGMHLKFAGFPSRRSPVRMFGTNLLPDQGQEVVLGPRYKARWQQAAAGLKSTWFEGGATANKDLGLFRVWSSKFDDPSSSPAALWRSTFSLTDAARASVDRFRAEHRSVTIGCVPKGMPTIMEQPYPIEFVKKGEAILLRLEEYDIVRTIHLKPVAGATPPPLSAIGHSVGHWEGTTLVVETTRLSWPYISNEGVPQSTASRLVERFTPSADGARLDYRVTVTDPQNLKMPVELKRAWVWKPGEQVRPYRCGDGQEDARNQRNGE